MTPKTRVINDVKEIRETTSFKCQKVIRVITLTSLWSRTLDRAQKLQTLVYRREETDVHV